MITSNPGGKPPAKFLNTPTKKMLPERKATKAGYGMTKPSSTSTTKKVKSFMKKYGQA
jgi:hypothetical protein